jgi:hypothetical protein
MIDSLAEHVKPLVLELLRQNNGLTVRVDELVAQNNKAPLVRIRPSTASRRRVGELRWPPARSEAEPSATLSQG